MGAWETRKLGELAEITSSKRIFLADYVNEGVPFYRSKEVIERSKGNEISTELFITEEKFRSIDAKFGVPRENDILLTSVGTIGIPYQVRAGDRFYFKDGNLTWFRNFRQDVEPKYVRYWITSKTGKERIDKTRIGSTQQAITIVGLKNIEVELPPLEEQKAIVKILSSLDDKIELNRRMNATLEAMARALFKAWFVDFEPVHANQQNRPSSSASPDIARLFPSTFENEIPKGWRYDSLGEIADVNWGDTSVTKQSYVDDGFPAYSASGNDGLLSYYDFDKTGIVVSAIGANSGLTWLASGKWSAIKNTMTIFATDENISTEYLFLATLGKENWVLRGSAQPFLSQTDTRAKQILYPSNNLAKHFGSVVEKFSGTLDSNRFQNKLLAEIRDSLLPRLISGNLKIGGLPSEGIE